MIQDVNELLELHPFPADEPEFCLSLLGLMLADLMCSVVYSRVVRRVFALKEHAIKAFNRDPFTKEGI